MSDLGTRQAACLLLSSRMRNAELIKRVARDSGIGHGVAADHMDRTVNQIIRALKSGQAARLPGLGTLKPGKRWTFREEKP